MCRCHSEAKSVVKEKEHGPSKFTEEDLLSYTNDSQYCKLQETVPCLIAALGGTMSREGFDSLQVYKLYFNIICYHNISNRSHRGQGLGVPAGQR